MMFMAGPGHGAPGVLAPVYLEGTYSEIYPDKSQDERRFAESFSRNFHFPAASAAIALRKRRGRFMRAENWGMSCPMLAARLSTIPT